MSSLFHQLGHPDADLMVAKSAVGIAIFKGIKARGLTQKQAAEAMGIPRSEVSRLMSAKLSRFTLDRLVKILLALDPTTRVSVKIEAAPYL